MNPLSIGVTISVLGWYRSYIEKKENKLAREIRLPNGNDSVTFTAFWAALFMILIGVSLLSFGVLMVFDAGKHSDVLIPGICIILLSVWIILTYVTFLPCKIIFSNKSLTLVSVLKHKENSNKLINKLGDSYCFNWRRETVHLAWKEIINMECAVATSMKITTVSGLYIIPLALFDIKASAMMKKYLFRKLKLKI